MNGGEILVSKNYSHLDDYYSLELAYVFLYSLVSNLTLSISQGRSPCSSRQICSIVAFFPPHLLMARVPLPKYSFGSYIYSYFPVCHSLKHIVFFLVLTSLSSIVLFYLRNLNLLRRSIPSFVHPDHWSVRAPALA